jgi:phosphatidyl-myo-inositol dimannoside synthase
VARHLLVTNDFPPKTGGIQSYLYELWRRLEPGRAVVVTASSHPDAAPFDASSELVIERVARSTLYLPTRRARREIEAAIARHRPDLVLLDPAWPLGLLGRRLSVPYGVVLHGAEVAIPGRLPFVASSLRRVLVGASVAVAAGQYCAGEARRNAADRMPPVVVVAPGVDTERFTPLDPAGRRAARAELGVGDDALLVVSYSRLVPRKGMDVLIEASARLARDYPDLQVLIAGEGRDRRRLERLARRRRAPVRFVGRTSEALHPRFVASADAMVVACRNRWLGLEQEGFGIVFAEAAACGVPPIAGRSGGSDEAVHDGFNGIVVAHPERARDVEAALRDLLSDPERRALYAERSRRLAEDVFDWRERARVLAHGLAPYDRYAPAAQGVPEETAR